MPDSILGSAPGDDLAPGQAALALVRAAGHADWRAAAWIAERCPSTRATWSDLARQEAVRGAVVAKVLRAVEATMLPPDVERRLLLALQAHGVGLPDADDVEL